MLDQTRSTPVKNRWNGATRFWPLAAGALVALACGNGIDTPSEDDAPPVIDRDTCEDNPLLAGCITDTEETPVEEAPEDPGAPVEDSTSELELARAAAENVLRANCGQCHGPQLTQAAARAGMNFIDDIDELVSQGKIVPLDPENSPVVRRMKEGSMPPLGTSGPRPSERDIALVEEFVNNPLFWPEYRPAASCAGQLMTFDDLYREISSDVRGLDDNDRPFTRYITLMNRYNSGACVETLDRDRFAILKLVNMLSTRASIGQPEPIDENELIYRINIRDYDWDRDINGSADGWEAIIAESPYAIPFVGDQADDVREDTETDVPVMYADALLDVAALGDLYYEMIGVQTGQSLADFVTNDLGIDVQDNLEDGEAVRAGTTRSAISREDRVVERHEIGRRPGAYWQTFDFASDQANESIFTDPINFNQGGSQAIFTLPNGLLGFIIADENDNIVTETNLLLDTFQDDFIARTSVSCSNCHAQGFNMVTDEVLPFVLANRRRLAREDFEIVNEVYLGPDEFAEVIESDSAAYQVALQRAGLPTTGGDPVANTFLRFNDDLDLAHAAGELGVTEADLRANLNLLDPRLSVLRQSTVDREDFTNTFEESLCIMQIISQNTPDPNRCDQFLDD
jgi:mono/diheme cytochrome c family protein